MVTGSLLSPMTYYRWNSKIVFDAYTVTIYIAVFYKFYTMGSSSINGFINIGAMV